MKLSKNVLVLFASLLFASSAVAEDYSDTIVEKHGKAISFDVASKKILKTAECNKKQIAPVENAKVVNVADIKGNKKPYLLVSSDEETTEDDLTAGPLSNTSSNAELKKLVGQKYCVVTFE